MTTGRVLLASTLASQAPKSKPSMVVRAVLAAAIVAALVSCQGEGPARQPEIPPSPVAAAPVRHAWCGPACADLPNLGREPRVSGRVVYTITVERP